LYAFALLPERFSEKMLPASVSCAITGGYRAPRVFGEIPRWVWYSMKHRDELIVFCLCTVYNFSLVLEQFE